MSKKRTVDRKLESLKALEQELHLKENLPHLYGNKMYTWQREFFYTKNKNAFLCSANQVGKTEIQGRRLINLATQGDNWQEWFTTKPDCFWYLLPSKEMVEAVIDLKWRPQLLPRGTFRDHPKYGWNLKKAHGSYNYLEFNSGVRVYFKSYSMGADVLQSGTCDYIAFDEELPWDLYSELNMRRTARNGYLSGVLTPTTGQEEWRKVFEEKGEKEVFPKSFKKQVSLYDSQKFVDGSPSHWTDERIQGVIQSCATEQEIQRRVYGRFVKSEGLMYPMFSISRNVKPPTPINLSSGCIYAAVDPGAGKTSPGSHPAAMTFIWTNSEHTKGIIFKGWKSPEGMALEPRDILAKYSELKGTMIVTGEYYDWKCKDFETVGTRSGFAFQKADKARDFGHQMINLLFKSEALTIFDLEELQPLIAELLSLGINDRKNEAVDDYVDSMRYAITSIPWNWEKITDIKVEFDVGKIVEDKVIDLRMNPPEDLVNQASELESEIEFWNTIYESNE